MNYDWIPDELFEGKRLCIVSYVDQRVEACLRRFIEAVDGMSDGGSKIFILRLVLISPHSH